MLAVTTGEQGLLPCLSHSEGPAWGSLDQALKEARVLFGLGCPETQKRAPSNQYERACLESWDVYFWKKKSSMFNHDLTAFLKASFNQKGKFCSLQKAFSHYPVPKGASLRACSVLLTPDPQPTQRHSRAASYTVPYS